MSAGVGAGVAAIFNGPLAGAIVGYARWLIPGLAGGSGELAVQAIARNFALGALPILRVARFFLTMTGQYEFMLPLLILYLSAYAIAEVTEGPAINDVLTHREPLIQKNRKTTS